eukprot:3935387-Prymnesium_polylepis.1
MRRLCAPKRAWSSLIACISALTIAATSRRDIASPLASQKRGVPPARAAASTRSSRSSSTNSSTGSNSKPPLSRKMVAVLPVSTFPFSTCSFSAATSLPLRRSTAAGQRGRCRPTARRPRRRAGQSRRRAEGRRRRPSAPPATSGPRARIRAAGSGRAPHTAPAYALRPLAQLAAHTASPAKSEAWTRRIHESTWPTYLRAESTEIVRPDGLHITSHTTKFMSRISASSFSAVVAELAKSSAGSAAGSSRRRCT